MYSNSIIFEAYHLYTLHSSYNMVASILRNKYNYTIARQIVTSWLKSIDKFFDNFKTKRLERKPKINVINNNIVNDASKIIEIDSFAINAIT